MSRPLALAFVGWRTAVLIGAGLLRLGGRIPDRARTPTDALRCERYRSRLDAPETTCPTIRVAQSRVKSKEENVMNVLAIGRYGLFPSER